MDTFRHEGIAADELEDRVTLGHENAGWVDGVGDGVTTVADGDAVARLPDNLEPAVAAPLTDAGLTPYHAIRRSWPKMGPTSTVVVIGVGGLGHVALQLVKATTAARVIAVDNRKEARDLAAALGADDVLPSDDSAASAIKDLTGGHGADVLLDFVGASPTIELARRAARTLADVTIIGVGGGSVPLSFVSQPGGRRALSEIRRWSRPFARSRGCPRCPSNRSGTPRCRRP